MIADLVAEIPEADFDIASDDSQGQVEIIGWLYQYYNQEPHHEVVDINGGPVKERDIPAATQLFTTDWVVRYMVDNSLGRYYLEHTPDSKISDQLQYLLPGELHQSSRTLDLSKLRVLDNAMGSGHILVYAFDVLMAIFEEQGYSRREAADQIATHNLYGLEIDKRAYQLAYFAVMMKVRQYDRRAFDRELALNLFVFEDSKNLSDEFLNHLALSDDDLKALTEISDGFKDAKTLGSIIHFEHNFDTNHLLEILSNIEPDSLFLSEPDLAQLSRLVQITAVLQTKYDVVVTNPPYLNKMDKTLKSYVKKYYKDYSGDLFSVFIWLNSTMTVDNGYSAYMTPFVWMFIKTYEALRTKILDTVSISSLIQMEYSAFEEATVPIDTFVLKNSHDQIGSYVKLSAFKGGMEVQRQKVLEAISDPNCKYLYRANQANFGKIPGTPISYWYLAQDYLNFKRAVPDCLDARKGVLTGNDRILKRMWYEVSRKHLSFNLTSASQLNENTVWVPITSGGLFRKWFGNIDEVIRMQGNGRCIVEHSNNYRLRETDYYFRAGFSWTEVTSGKKSFRSVPEGVLFGNGGSLGFSLNPCVSNEVLLGLLNSIVGQHYLALLAPTLNLGPDQLRNYPIIPIDNTEKVSQLVSKNIALSQADCAELEDSMFFKIPVMFAEHTLALLKNIGQIRPLAPNLCQIINYIKQRRVE